MNEKSIDWGCPNGLDAADYSGHERWDNLTWRWEFVRRSARYRVAFEIEAIQAMREANKPAPPDLIWKPEFKDFVNYPKSNQPTFGLPVWVNPLYSDSVYRLKEQPSRTEVESRRITGLELNRIELGMIKPYDVLSVFDAAIRFDLSRPIAPQLEGIEDFLESLRYHGATAPFQKEHKSKWITYLRILDAREAGASWTVCANRVMPPSTTSGVSAARAAHRAARRLQDTL